MPGPWVHRIDPVIGTVLGVHIWWYGLSYTLGLLNAHLYFMRRRRALGLSIGSVYRLTVLLSLGVLAGGRALVVFYEREYFLEHPAMVPAVWMGGMATHGLILGGLAGVIAFCLIEHKPFLLMIDELAVPAALILGFGRLGNFIDGQIVGAVTDVSWAVKFPDADGFRHPVVLYDGIKNLLIVPLLLWARRLGVPPGGLAVRFVVLYAGLRVPIDLLREYPSTWLGLPQGQAMNVILTLIGALLWLRNRRRRTLTPEMRAEAFPREVPASPRWWQRALVAGVLLFPLIIPSDGVRDVPARYGARHPGLSYSAVYPPVSEHQD
ncbi:MAG: prolipoprotein diacylglyceryl transferase [Acidobacteriota bacterium]